MPVTKIYLIHIMRSKKCMYEVFFYGEATFQDSNKVQVFRINQTMKRFRYLNRMHPLQELCGSLRYVLCFTIYISLRHNLRYTLQEVVVYYHRFLSSKAYQNRYQVIGIGPGVPCFISWMVALERLGPRYQILGFGYRVLVPGPWLLLTLIFTVIFFCAGFFKIILSVGRHCYNATTKLNEVFVMLNVTYYK